MAHSDSRSAHATHEPIHTATGENAGPTRGRRSIGTGMWTGAATVVLVLIVLAVIL